MAISNTPAQDYVQSDYSNSARLNINGSAQEQKFIENLIVETIEIYGQNIYYVPRTLVNRDSVFGEDSDSKFESAKPIRAYVNMLKDGKDKVSYLANLESVSKTRQLLYSPVRNLKLLWTTVRSLTSKDDRTKGT